MTEFVAALPMYDWPEVRAETDAQWARVRDLLRQHGVDAPQALTRSNNVSSELDLVALWRDPRLLLSQTCWGPMGLGLAEYVQVIGQPDYSEYEGGKGELYSSAVVMRRDETPGADLAAPADGCASLPLRDLRKKRFAFNSADSMSGLLSLTRDLEAAGNDLNIFAERVVSGGHRASIVMVAEGRADVAAVDCQSWAMARRFEPAAEALTVVGWTSHRKGLPFITSKETPMGVVAKLKQALTSSLRDDFALSP